ncbi:MAG: hypothetical protein HOW73_00085 [Polyangiaceae bacterium]|nr:hypothetical protein [Polyangiaceae bacterium]
MTTYGNDSCETVAARYILRSMAALGRCRRTLETGDLPSLEDYAALTTSLRQLERVVDRSVDSDNTAALERLTSLKDDVERLRQRLPPGGAAASL